MIVALQAALKPGRSFLENARVLIPALLDEFLSRRGRVIAHPRLKKDLHKMRLDGKTLRYAMEIFASSMSDDFAASLQEVKGLLDLMGTIHDCDVNAVKLQEHLREIRLFNRVTQSARDRIRTVALTRLIGEQQKVRLAAYGAACAAIQKMVSDNFRERVVSSMNIPATS